MSAETALFVFSNLNEKDELAPVPVAGAGQAVRISRVGKEIFCILTSSVSLKSLIYSVL